MRALFFCVLLVLGACSGPADSPEKQIRDLIARGEEAAEAKDLSAAKKLISDAYADRRGNDRQAVLGLLRYHYLRNESIHLLTRTGRIAFPQEHRAEVTVFVAMAGVPLDSPEQFAALRADLYRFDLILAREEKGRWKLITADWNRARAADFL